MVAQPVVVVDSKESDVLALAPHYSKVRVEDAAEDCS